MALTISVQPTPNPNSLKFTVNQQVLASGSKFYPSAEKAAESPIALELFNLGSVTAVMLSANFVSVNKAPDAAWPSLIPAIQEILQKHLAAS